MATTADEVYAVRSTIRDVKSARAAAEKAREMRPAEGDAPTEWALADLWKTIHAFDEEVESGP